MKGQLYQLRDGDGEEAGLLWTNAPAGSLDLGVLWTQHYHDERADGPNADDFAEWLESKYRDWEFERVYVEDLNA